MTLHIGEAHEVKAAAAAFAGSITTVTGQVDAIITNVKDVALSCRPESPLDIQLVATHDEWIATPICEAVVTSGKHAPETDGRTKHIVNAYTTEDDASGARIRRLEV
ncbi:hypothetical protein ACLMAL_36255 [Nocardia sp. CWNU-33]|uniref:hypothetical protein n=1 Tax=Nocardia sp. CWNU-33 TaxID=3392117 RepID=UPI00398E46E4